MDAAATKAARFISEKLESSSSDKVTLSISEESMAVKWRTPFFGSPLKVRFLLGYAVILG